MRFANTWVDLGPAFYERAAPRAVARPRVFLWNDALARALLVDTALPDEATRAEVFAGNRVPSGAAPIALAYAGHQFGHFAPRLGDGRAHLLGELCDLEWQRWDVQLKGSGPTPFSRGGDGRCALGPAVREFVMSEAMHALGVPTTRCLAVVSTGEPVFRDERLPGAVVTRVAASHIRVGSFEYFAARGEIAALRKLADYAIERHHPELIGTDDRYLAFFEAVVERQIHLITEWMRVGFIHGVMNTDNTAISGETIDFGPCAMLGAYDPSTVYSSIDRRGRYAFGNQPGIARWNMARLAEALLPLIDDDQDRAVARVEPVLESFPERFATAFSRMMGRKLGLPDPLGADRPLVDDLLTRMEAARLDYTITFDRLTRALIEADAQAELLADLPEWGPRWRARIDALAHPPAELHAELRRANPVVIPRNHHVEAMLAACVETGRPDSAERLLEVLRSPYAPIATTARYQDPPADGDADYRTFCGT